MSNKKFKWNKELIQKYINTHQLEQLNKKDSNTITGFIWACINNDKLAKFMLEKDNIDFNIQDQYGETGFMRICEYHPQLLFYILENKTINKKINKNLKNVDNETGWDLACAYNSTSFQIYKNYLQKEKIENNLSDMKKNVKKNIL